MGSRFSLESFLTPPQKVEKMFDAVNELVAQKADFSGLTVQDITEKAGVGKGTAYEYFSSKEELITLALFRDYGMKITELKGLMNQKDGFEQKITCVLDWIHSNQSYHRSFEHILKLSAGNKNPCQLLEDHISGEIMEQMHSYLLEECDAVMELGWKEQLYGEKDKVKRRMAFAAMVLQLVLTMGGESGENRFFSMDYETARTYVYESMIKALA